MNFTLTIHGETPEELLDALTHLGGTTSITNTSSAPKPQSEPVPQPEKSKAQTSAKPKRGAQKPAAAPAEEQQANPTMTDSVSAPAAPAATSSAATSAPTATPATATSSEPGKDPATEDKIRSLIMALMKQGKTKECKAIITSAGAASISAIKPESYTAVWEQLCKLNEEVNQNAAE